MFLATDQLKKVTKTYLNLMLKNRPKEAKKEAKMVKNSQSPYRRERAHFVIP